MPSHQLKPRRVAKTPPPPPRPPDRCSSADLDALAKARFEGKAKVLLAITNPLVSVYVATSDRLIALSPSDHTLLMQRLDVLCAAAGMVEDEHGVWQAAP